MSRIIITGGNRGIGFEVAKQLGEKGHDVILTARDENKGKQAAESLSASFFPLDVSSEESINRFVQLLTSEFDVLDVLINNAGIFIDDDLTAIDMNFDILYQTMETNVYGPWKLTKGLHPLLSKSEDPRIINVSSGLGAISDMGSGYPSYRMS